MKRLSIKNLLFGLLMLFSVSLSPAFVFAADPDDGEGKFSPVKCDSLGIICEEEVESDKFIEVIRGVVNVFLSLVAVIAAVAIIYGGVLYLLSGGEEDKAKKAKNVLLYAVIGLIVIGLSAAIVNFAISSFG